MKKIIQSSHAHYESCNEIPSEHRDSLVTETITLGYWDEYRWLWLVVHSNYTLKLIPCIVLGDLLNEQKETISVTTEGGHRWTFTYQGRTTITNEWTTSIMMLVVDERTNLLQKSRRGPVKAACRCYTAAGRHLWLKWLVPCDHCVLEQAELKSTNTVINAHTTNGLSSLNMSNWFAIEAALLTLHLNKADFSNVKTLWVRPPCTGTVLMMCRGIRQDSEQWPGAKDGYQQAVVFNHLSQTPLDNGCPMVCKL